MAGRRDLMGFISVPPALSDGLSQKTVPELPSGNQENKGRDGCQDLGGPSVERTDCPRGGKEGGLPRGAPGGAGISLAASQWEGAHKQLLQKARSEVELLVPAWIWPGQTPALCQWTQEWLGRPEILFNAHQALLGTQLDNKRND